MQSPIIIAFGNLIDPTRTVLVSSPVTLAPAAYTAADFRGVSARASAIASSYFQVTWSTAQTFNALALLDNNLSANGTVELHASSDAFATVDATLLPASIMVGNPSLFVFDQVTGYTSARIILKDPGNADGYIQFGKLFIGTAFVPSVNYQWGWSAGLVDRSEKSETLNKVPHFNRKPKQRMPKTGFVKVPDEDRLLVEALVDTVGTTEPFYVALDPDNHPDQTYYVRIASALPEPRNDCVARFSYTLHLEEGL